MELGRTRRACFDEDTKDGDAGKEMYEIIIKMTSSLELVQKDNNKITPPRYDVYRSETFPDMLYGLPKKSDTDGMWMYNEVHFVVCYKDTPRPRVRVRAKTRANSPSLSIPEFTAFCFMFLDRMFGRYDVQTLCVHPSSRGQGVCRDVLMPGLKALYLDSAKARRVYPEARELHVVCETRNAYACKCYAAIPGAIVVRRKEFTSFSYARTPARFDSLWQTIGSHEAT